MINERKAWRGGGGGEKLLSSSLSWRRVARRLGKSGIGHHPSGKYYCDNIVRILLTAVEEMTIFHLQWPYAFSASLNLSPIFYHLTRDGSAAEKRAFCLAWHSLVKRRIQKASPSFSLTACVMAWRAAWRVSTSEHASGRRRETGMANDAALFPNENNGAHYLRRWSSWRKIITIHSVGVCLPHPHPPVDGGRLLETGRDVGKCWRERGVDGVMERHCDGGVVV